MAIFTFTKDLEAIKSTTAETALAPSLGAADVAVTANLDALAPNLVLDSRIRECIDFARDAGYAAGAYSIPYIGGTVTASAAGAGDVGIEVGTGVQSAGHSVIIDSALHKIREFIRENK